MQTTLQNKDQLQGKNALNILRASCRISFSSFCGQKCLENHSGQSVAKSPRFIQQNSGRKKQPKDKVFGQDIPGTSGTQTWGYPGQKFMQEAFFCCSRHGVAGMSGIWVGTSQLWKKIMQENFGLIFRTLKTIGSEDSGVHPSSPAEVPCFRV